MTTKTVGKVVTAEERATLDLRPVPSVPDHFASPDGRIFSCARAGRLRERRTHRTHDGYLLVVMNANRRSFGRGVHTMVCEAFHGPKPSTEHETRHLDGHRLNNRADNLAWGTKQENADDKRRHGTVACGERHFSKTHPEKLARGERQGLAILTEALVRRIRERADAGESVASIARDMGTPYGPTYRAARRQLWKHVEG